MLGIPDTRVMTVGLYAGSFDPLHLGHLSLIETASRWCDILYVVAAGNPAKRTGLFGLDERRRLVEASTDHLVNVIALRHEGLVVDLARSLEADVLIRGIGKGQRTEFEMAVANEHLADLPTLFLPPSAETMAISSTLVRAELALGGAESIVGLVPHAVLDALRRRESDLEVGRPGP